MESMMDKTSKIAVILSDHSRWRQWYSVLKKKGFNYRFEKFIQKKDCEHLLVLTEKIVRVTDSQIITYDRQSEFDKGNQKIERISFGELL